ncbi:MAG TPA: hypothetical protein VK168_13510 [Saprospiraceae bacterium]|nr:hypothetical protein [Saprospiraceae bacterium]
MISWLKRLYQVLFTQKPISDEAPFVWCLIGNIKEQTEQGTEHELRQGTKHFSPGAKIYCMPVMWGDGYENIQVIGLHRKSKKYICIVMPSRHITGWRLQKVYKPYILQLMAENKGWTNTNQDRETILSMAKSLPR